MNVPELIRKFQADYQSVTRFYDLPWSHVCFDRLEALCQEWQKRLLQLDFNELDQSGRIDYVLFHNRLEAELHRIKLNRERLAKMEQLLGFWGPVQGLESARWQMKPLDPQAAAQVVSVLPEQLKQLQKRLERGKIEEKPMPATSSKELGANAKLTSPESPHLKEPAPIKISPAQAKRVAGAVADVRTTLKTWYANYEGYQPEFSWWMKKPYEEASKSLEDYEKFLREEIAGLKGKDEDPLLAEPVGAKALEEDLTREMIAYSPKQLMDIGQKELAWCEAELKRASKAMGFGENWKKAMAKVKSDYAPPGRQDELIAACGREAVRFVKEHELVTVPALCEETWRVTMISSDAQKTLPYAAYGGQKVLAAYAREEMKYEDKLMSMRGNNRHFTRSVIAHEVIPGHHLQSFVGSRYSFHRDLFATPFFFEGWALYWELMLWDQGYAQSPEDRIGMLFWRMHRCARIIVSLKFQLGQMTPQEMVDFLVERVGHEKFGARSEVRRFIDDNTPPLYQCGYMIGGLQLRALRHEMVGPGKLTDQAFNDTVLTYGAIPIELIRAGMQKLPLTREGRPHWKFAD